VSCRYPSSVRRRLMRTRWRLFLTRNSVSIRRSMRWCSNAASSTCPWKAPFPPCTSKPNSSRTSVWARRPVGRAWPQRSRKSSRTTPACSPSGLRTWQSAWACTRAPCSAGSRRKAMVTCTCRPACATASPASGCARGVSPSTTSALALVFRTDGPFPPPSSAGSPAVRVSGAINKVAPDGLTDALIDTLLECRMSERTELLGKHIELGLSGGIACYKSAELLRLLTKAGATVQVVMTEAAQAFITPVTMQALSGRAVYTDQWDAREGNNMAHINLSREADVVLVAPASADL